MPSFRVFFAVAAVFASIRAGSSLRCYSCMESADVNCGDPFNKKTSTILDCSTNTTTCIKYILGRYGDDVQYIERTCNKKGFCEQFAKFCYECGTDLCNSSSNAKPLFIFIVFVVKLYLWLSVMSF